MSRLRETRFTSATTPQELNKSGADPHTFRLRWRDQAQSKKPQVQVGTQPFWTGTCGIIRCLRLGVAKFKWRSRGFQLLLFDGFNLWSCAPGRGQAYGSKQLRFVLDPSQQKACNFYAAGEAIFLRQPRGFFYVSETSTKKTLGSDFYFSLIKAKLYFFLLIFAEEGPSPNTLAYSNVFYTLEKISDRSDRELEHRSLPQLIKDLDHPEARNSVWRGLRSPTSTAYDGDHHVGV